ncbi:MAG TPA: hypothetical protein VJT68_08095 [Thermoleophilaceae bacterium]|nr:hypothetical protein [Thermoleophilaceae bacterium]
MSPSAVVPSVEAPPAPPERPGFFAVAVATFLGYFVAAIVLVVVGIVLLVAGVGLTDVGDTAGRGLFYRYDVWSWTAEACAAILITGLTALLVNAYLSARTNWEVPFGTTFLTLLLTGYAPALALTPLYGATAVVSLFLAAIVLRWRARPSGAEPMTLLGQVPRRLRRTVAIGLAIAVPLMGAYVVGYALTHPLRFDWNTQAKRAVAHEPGARMFFEFGIANISRPVVTDLELVKTEGSPTLQVERAGSTRPGDIRFEGAGAIKPMSAVELKRNDFDDEFVLVLRQGASCPTDVARLDAIWVRYTVLSMRHEQRIPLVHGPAVRCR